MPKNNSKDRRAERRIRAQERQARFDRLSIAEKYERSRVASKERAKWAVELLKGEE